MRTVCRCEAIGVLLAAVVNAAMRTCERVVN